MEKKVVLGREEKNVGKGENAGYQHFLFFSQCFQRAFSLTVSKVVIVWQMLIQRIFGERVCMDDC